MKLRAKNMPRTRLQREADLKFLTEGILVGKGINELQEALAAIRPYKLSVPTISRDVSDIEHRWKDRAFRNSSFVLGEELAKLNLYEREAWAQWQRSKEEKLKTAVMMEEGGKTSGVAKKRQTVNRETKAGDIAFLSALIVLHEKRVKLLGLEPATKIMVGELPEEAAGLSLADAEAIVDAAVRSRVRPQDVA